MKKIWSFFKKCIFGCGLVGIYGCLGGIADRFGFKDLFPSINLFYPYFEVYTALYGLPIACILFLSIKGRKNKIKGIIFLIFEIIFLILLGMAYV